MFMLLNNGEIAFGNHNSESYVYPIIVIAYYKRRFIIMETFKKKIIYLIIKDITMALVVLKQ